MSLEIRECALKIGNEFWNSRTIFEKLWTCFEKWDPVLEYETDSWIKWIWILKNESHSWMKWNVIWKMRMIFE